jgi:hypothetical protein
MSSRRNPPLLEVGWVNRDLQDAPASGVRARTIEDGCPNRSRPSALSLLKDTRT